MKKFGILFAGALAFFALASCNDDLEVSPNESYFASEATIASSDSNVTITGNEAEVTFKVEGGTVTFTVDCGCEWTATSYKPEYFTATTTPTSVTITAVQNTIENELAGVVSLMTAGESIQFAKIQVYQNAYGAPEITVSSNEWNAPAVGALTTEIAVTASDEWDIENTAEWLTVEKTGTGISLATTENEETEERVAKVVLTCTDGISSDSETITVTQDGKAYITLSEESLAFEGEAATASVTVESNYDLECGSSADWLKVSVNGNTLSVDVTDNDTGEAREGIVTLTAGDGAENVAEAQLAVSQEALINKDALILVYITTSSNQEIELPLDETVDCTIDWGDGSEIETCTSVWPTHTYVSPGEYSVVIDGTVTSLYSSGLSSSTLLTEIIQWGNTGLTEMQYAFYGCTGITTLPSDTRGAFSDVTTFRYAFNECSGLRTIPADLFKYCSNVTNYNSVFRRCSSLENIPAGLFDNSPQNTNFQYAFERCGISSVPKGLFDNCPLVTTYANIFNLCENLNSIPTGLFSSGTLVTSFSYVLYGTAIKEIPDKLFANCSSATNFSYAFSSCSELQAIPEDLFVDCSSATNVSFLFQKCTALVSIPTGLFSSCKKVETFTSTFIDDSALTGESPYDLIDGTKVHIYEREDYPDIYETPYGIANCFRNCTGLQDYENIPSSWGGGGM